MSRPPSPSRRLLFSSPLVLLVALGCAGCGDDGTPGNNDKPIDQVEAFFMKGVVKDAAGNPLEGVEVFADDTAGYNTNLFGTTNAKGEYVISLPKERATTYRPGAEIRKQWDGQAWRLPLQPDNATAFAANTGGIRNFTWKLSGRDFNNDPIGQRVWVYTDSSDEAASGDAVEVHFAPAGPLIDGSTGEAFTMRPAEQSENPDVPLGRYTVTAKNADDPSVVLKVRVRNEGDYVPSIEAGFKSSTIHGMMEIEVSSQP